MFLKPVPDIIIWKFSSAFDCENIPYIQETPTNIHFKKRNVDLKKKKSHNADIMNAIVSWFCSSSRIFRSKWSQNNPWLDPIVQILFVLESKSLNLTVFYVLKTCMKSQDWVFLHQNYIPSANGERPWNKSWIVSSRDIRVKVVQKWLPDPIEFLSGSPGSNICWLRIKILTSSCWFAKNMH